MIKDKVVLITGGSRGIGAGTALNFARRGGWSIIINYITHDKEAIKLKENIANLYNTEVMLIKADVSNEKDVKSMIEKIINKYGKIDVLVNNAGIAIDKEFKDRTLKDFH